MSAQQKRKADELDGDDANPVSKVKAEAGAAAEDEEEQQEDDGKVVGVQTDDGIAFDLGKKSESYPLCVNTRGMTSVRDSPRLTTVPTHKSRHRA